jgi:hypothetical protein
LARLSASARSVDGVVEATVYIGRDFLGDKMTVAGHL